MSALQFAHTPWLVAGIVAGGGLVFAYRYFDQKNRADLEKFVSGKLLSQFLAGISKPRRWAMRSSFVLATVLLFVALARPQVGHEWREVKRKGIDILFALDASRSMLAEDVSPNRLERAKLGMIDFVEKLEGDRVGLMPFAGSAFMLCPLTLDYHAFRESLDAIDTDIIPHKGTDLASAIREAERTFNEADNNHKILVVITDGEDLQGEAIAAAKQAAKSGMAIHTVGIGSTSGELIPIGNDFVRDQSGELVRSKLDEKSLQEIAAATGGIYAPFGQGAEGLRQIYAEKLSLVPKGELAQRMQKVPIERFHWPLSIAIALLFAEFLIGERRQQRRGKKSPAAATATALVTIVLLGTIHLAEAADARLAYNRGVESYQGGDLESAMQSFQETIEGSDDLALQTRAYYNLGNTAFKTGASKFGEKADRQAVISDWERSLEAFDGALALDPDDEDAKFNREFVQRKLDELKKQQQQDQKKKEGDREKSEQKDEGEPEDSESEKQEDKPADAGEKDDPKEQDGEEKKQEASKPEPGDKKPDQEEAGDSDERPKPGEGKLETETEPKPSPDQQAAGVPEQERREPGEMSKEEARQLLQALENDEERVLLVPAKRGDPHHPHNTTKGKDW